MQAWRQKLSHLAGFRIGIGWQGSTLYRGDRCRSMPLSCFAPLADVPGVRLVSLQKGAGAEQLAEARGRFSLVDFGADLDEASGPFMGHCRRDDEPRPGRNLRLGRGTPGRSAGRAGVGRLAAGARLALAVGPPRLALVSPRCNCSASRETAIGRRSLQKSKRRCGSACCTSKQVGSAEGDFGISNTAGKPARYTQSKRLLYLMCEICARGASKPPNPQSLIPNP